MSEASFRARKFSCANVPFHVKFFSDTVDVEQFPSLVVLSYKSTENIYVIASFYAQLSMYQC